jgi:hypothetical protein
VQLLSIGNEFLQYCNQTSVVFFVFAKVASFAGKMHLSSEKNMFLCINTIHHTNNELLTAP